MEIIAVPIDRLVFDPSNARKHSEKNLAAIKGSLAKFGQQKPIVIDKNNVVVAGNGTLAAAKALGWTDISAVKTDLEGTAAVAFAVADNRSAELAEWDSDVLSKTLEALKAEEFDLEGIGFDDGDLSQWLKEAEKAPPKCDEDEVPEHVEPKTKLGDLYQLGEHRLLCGDSTDVLQVERLMAGAKADMVFTDPPYNQGVNPSGFLKDRPSFKKLSESNLNDFEPEAFCAVVTTLSPQSFYVHCNKELIVNYVEYARRSGRLWDLLAICKANPIPSKGNKFLSDIEWIIFSRAKGAYFDDTHNYDWYRKAQKVATKKSEFGHPTEKWVALIEQYLQISSKQNQVVVDLFLGSGSTLIACEKTKRKCYGMELDPHYCDVIVARWEKFTGDTAKLVTRQDQ